MEQDPVLRAVDEIVRDVEEIFPPKPGGMVDRHRKRRAEQEAAAAEERNAAEAIQEPSYKAVKVAPESPETFAAQTVTIAAGGNALILPFSPYRYRAVVAVITAASSVVLAKDQSAALGQVGFTLATAAPPLQLFTRAQVWAFNPGGATVQVSVLAESYAPGK